MKEIINMLSGYVVCIGLDNKFEKLINNNKNIIQCTMLSDYNKKEKKLKGIKGKNIDIKNIRRIFKKKKVDFIICNYNVINKFFNTFVKDSIFICSKQVIYYNIENEENLIKKYKRYNALIKKEKKFLKIDTSSSKTNFFKDYFYRIIDFFDKIIELIGDILMG